MSLSIGLQTLPGYKFLYLTCHRYEGLGYKKFSLVVADSHEIDIIFCLSVQNSLLLPVLQPKRGQFSSKIFRAVLIHAMAIYSESLEEVLEARRY